MANILKAFVYHPAHGKKLVELSEINQYLNDGWSNSPSVLENKLLKSSKVKKNKRLKSDG